MKNSIKFCLGTTLVLTGWYLCDLAGLLLDGSNWLVNKGGRMRTSAIAEQGKSDA